MAQQTLQIMKPVPKAPQRSTEHKVSASQTGWTFMILMHLACLGVFYVGWSWSALTVAAALYFVRMFAITGAYHRYFSHRSYKTSRPFQLFLAILGASAAQQGPLWWAANHRHHHKFSDQPEDIHSPKQKGFWYSHIGWIVEAQNEETDYALIPDFTRYPEMVWVDKYNILFPFLLGVATFGLGVLVPDSTGLQMLIWGFFVSTVVLYHGTFSINSLAHVFGSRRYATKDTSRNNFWLALITLGEGWHNNHHYYATSTRQGFYWWEIDITYYILWVCEKIGLIWDIKSVPEHLKAKRI